MILHFFLIRSTSKNDIFPLKNDQIEANMSKTKQKNTLKRVFLQF